MESLPLPWIVLLVLTVAAGVTRLSGGLLIRLAVRQRWLDAAGSEAHKPERSRPTPNVGGVAVLLGLAAAAAVCGWWVGLWGADADSVALSGRLTGWVQVTAAVLLLHAAGLIDDRRPLPPSGKLLIQGAAASLVVFGADLTILDAAGPVVSAAVSLIWYVGVVNALNFLDNMDGLAGGVTAVTAATYAAAAFSASQPLVGLVAAAVTGAAMGFLLLNRPPARLYLGDGGSLPLGLLLAILAAALTYHDADDQPRWHAVLMPLMVFAVPIYDAAVVTALRLRAGRSPWIGDLNHLSHRLVRLGLTQRQTLCVIVLITAVTSLSGLVTAAAGALPAVLAATQVLLLLVVLGLLERPGYQEASGLKNDPQTRNAPSG